MKEQEDEWFMGRADTRRYGHRPDHGHGVLCSRRLVDQFRRRAFKPQPLVQLVCEMLASDIGWSGSNHYPRHVTGIEVEGYSAGSASLRIEGAFATLSRADKFRLHRAVQAYGKRQNRKQADAAAIELAAKVKLMARRVQEMSDNVVNIHPTTTPARNTSQIGEG